MRTTSVRREGLGLTSGLHAIASITVEGGRNDLCWENAFQHYQIMPHPAADISGGGDAFLDRVDMIFSIAGLRRWNGC